MGKAPSEQFLPPEERDSIGAAPHFREQSRRTNYTNALPIEM